MAKLIIFIIQAAWAHHHGATDTKEKALVQLQLEVHLNGEQ
jgi:hypothetical protein